MSDTRRVRDAIEAADAVLLPSVGGTPPLTHGLVFVAIAAALRAYDADVPGGGDDVTGRTLTDDARRLIALVDEQAKDARLWFDAETITEAALMQALRRLHAAVEGDWELVERLDPGADDD